MIDFKKWKKSHFILWTALFLSTSAVYWQSLYLPFIQDDWGFISKFHFNDFLTLLQSQFQFENRLFYRPLAETYLLFMLKIFGLNPVPIHIGNLTIHLINAILVERILYRIFGNYLLSCLSALIYSTAIAIHLDALGWAVGIYDIGGVLFFLLGFLYFLKNKPVLSAIFYFLGCLCKESVIILPLILVSYQLIHQDYSLPKKVVLTLLKLFFPFFVFGSIISALKLSGHSPLAFPASHPYVMHLTGHHLIDNGLLYFKWMLQSIFPVISLWRAINIPTIISGVIFVLYGCAATCRLKETALKKRMLFLLLWMFIAFLPVIFLPNHCYRYYCAYSLPAFIAVFLISLKSILLSFKKKGQTADSLLIFIAVISIVGSTFMGNQIYLEGLEQRTLSDGTNMLIRKGTFVNLVHKELKSNRANFPDDAIIILDDVNIFSFNKDDGPRVWFNNPTIKVFPLSSLKFENKMMYIENPIETQIQVYIGARRKRAYVNPSQLFIYIRSNKHLIPMDLEVWRTYLKKT